MALTDQQILRYSRQIIVPGMGGQAQERLLASKLLLIGAWSDINDPLAYLVGAGVGQIYLRTEHSILPDIAEHLRALNPDARVTVEQSNIVPDATLAIVGNESSRQLTQGKHKIAGPAILAILDAPPSLVIAPAPPPCVYCIAEDVDSSGARCETSGVITMIAVTECIKMLAGYAPRPKPEVIEFNGLESRTVAPMRPTIRPADCSCAA